MFEPTLGSFYDYRGMVVIFLGDIYYGIIGYKSRECMTDFGGDDVWIVENLDRIPDANSIKTCHVRLTSGAYIYTEPYKMYSHTGMVTQKDLQTDSLIYQFFVADNYGLFTRYRASILLGETVWCAWDVEKAAMGKLMTSGISLSTAVHIAQPRIHEATLL